MIAAKNGMQVDIHDQDGRWMTGLDHEACRAREDGRAVFFVRKDGEPQCATVEVA